jgi:ABC-type branched-subunit amino acid transport system substrate-binding protein
MKRLAVFILLTICCVAVCSGALAQGIVVGTIFDHTGALKEWGPGFQNAAELAAKKLASAGFEIQLVHEDSGTSADKAAKAAKKLIEQDKVMAILGSASSGVIVPVAESVTCPNNMLMISPGATSVFITTLPADKERDFLFRTCPSDALQGVALGMLAAGLYRTASVMYVDNPYGRGLAIQFKKSFEKRGGTVLAMVPHAERVAQSYTAELTDALHKIYMTKPFRPGKPDVLCGFSYPEHAKIYVKEAIERFKCESFLFCDGTKSEELAAAVGVEKLEGMMGTAPGTAGGLPFANFVADYRAAYGRLPRVPFIANTYDATALVGLAAYTAKAEGLPLTSKNIRDHVRYVANPPGTLIGPGEFDLAFELLKRGKDINYEGASGPVNFDKNGDVIAPIELWRFSKGEIVTYRMEYQIPEQ